MPRNCVDSRWCRRIIELEPVSAEALQSLDEANLHQDRPQVAAAMLHR